MFIHVAGNLGRSLVLFALLFASGLSATGCGGGSEAQRHGVGAACSVDLDCTEAGQKCLAFKGGYCGIADCTATSGCPSGSACVAHSDGHNYCFLTCVEKPECNRYRAADVAANCSANVSFVDGNVTRKACVPPSS